MTVRSNSLRSLQQAACKNRSNITAYIVLPLRGCTWRRRILPSFLEAGCLGFFGFARESVENIKVQIRYPNRSDESGKSLFDVKFSHSNMTNTSGSEIMADFLISIDADGKPTPDSLVRAQCSNRIGSALVRRTLSAFRPIFGATEAVPIT